MLLSKKIGTVYFRKFYSGAFPEPTGSGSGSDTLPKGSESGSRSEINCFESPKMENLRGANKLSNKSYVNARDVYPD